MSRFRISPAAERDISNIARYIARDNPARALTFARELRAAIAVIGERPLSFAERDHLPPGLRVALHRRYLILFELVDDVAHIVRVVHGARDIDNLFES